MTSKENNDFSEIDLSKSVPGKEYLLTKILTKDKNEIDKLKKIGLSHNSKILVKRIINNFIIISYLDYDYAIEIPLAKKILIKKF